MSRVLEQSHIANSAIVLVLAPEAKLLHIGDALHE
jgi:hypothetical protein